MSHSTSQVRMATADNTNKKWRFVMSVLSQLNDTYVPERDRQALFMRGRRICVGGKLPIHLHRCSGTMMETTRNLMSQSFVA